MSAQSPNRLVADAAGASFAPPVDDLARAVVDTVIEGIVVADADGRITQANPAIERIFGYRRNELIGRNVSCLTGAPHQAAHDDFIRRFLATGERRIIGTGREVEGRRRDGSTVPIELSVVHLRLGARDYFVGVMRDLTERRAGEAELAFNRRLGDAVGHAWDRFVAANRWSKVKLFDDALSDLIELSGSRTGFIGELVDGAGGPLVELLATRENNLHTRLPADDPRVADILAGRPTIVVAEGSGAPYLALPIRAGSRLVGVAGLHGRAGGYDTAQATALQPLLSALGSIVVGLQKVEAQRAAERDLYRTQERLREMATRDPLTGLLNRAALFEALNNAFERSRELGLALSVLFVDIDHFKPVNDRHGHAAGDAVLRAVAAAMHVAVRPQDLVGRYGGEEFVVGLLETDGVGAAGVAERIRAAVMTAPSPIPVTVSLGLASLDAGTDTLDQLLAHADAALYRAKANGRNRVER